MELLLKLRRSRGNTLPVNYSYAVSSWIYKVIAAADQDYSAFLHEKGFALGGRTFKMFTFSQLDLRPYEMLGNEIRLLGSEISFIVRFLVDSSLENFIKGLFMHQHFGLGVAGNPNHIDFEVTGIESKRAPVFRETMRYQTLSPMVVSTRRDDGSVAYLSPDQPEYGNLIIRNLQRKQRALATAGSESPAEKDAGYGSFRLLGASRKKGITIKENTEQETKVIGYLFSFELTAAPELHEVGYFAGFGEKNSMGFGCVTG